MCDGLRPAEQYRLDDPIPRVTGRAWIGTGSRKQDGWEFSLFLDNATRTREDVCWEALLPGDEVTGPVSIWRGRRLRVTPGRAVAA